MSNRKRLASIAIALGLVGAAVAPAAAGPLVQQPQFTRYVWCSILPAWCTY